MIDNPLFIKAVNEFWKHVKKSDGCWLWTYWQKGGSKRRYNYGFLNYGIGTKYIYAHRLSWMIHNPSRPIPKGMCVLHSCDNPRCVNPEHLRIGTQQENIADTISRNRQAVGERVGGSKLSRREVLAIARVYSNGRSSRSVAMEFGVSHHTVLSIKHRTSWKHVFNEFDNGGA